MMTRAKEYRPYAEIPRLYAGETVFVIASGPSLSNTALDRVRDRPAIAVNLSFEAAPWAGALYFSDARFFTWYQKRILRFPGLKFTGDPGRKIRHPDILQLELTGIRGLETKPGALCHGNNSGYAAINLAFHMGARRIALLGIDMSPDPADNTRQHWHPEHPVPSLSRVYQKMAPNFETLVAPLAAHGVEVVNCNLASAVECFRKCPLDEVIDRAKNSI